MEDNLPLYYTFLKVADLGNISHAAKELYVSQPAVSKAIANLEDNLKTTLFHRSSRGVTLTDEGKVLYGHVRDAIESLKIGEEHIRRIQELGMGYLKIGASVTLCKYILLPYLKDFVEENPHIRITIDNDSSYHTIKGLENDYLDIGLIAKPPKMKSLDFYSLGEVEDMFVATRTYLDHLKYREDSSNIFSTANIMLLDEENITRKYVDEYLKDNNIILEQALEVSNLDLLIEFAKTGLGIAGVIKNFVKSELEEGSLVQVHLPKKAKKREVGFAYKSNSFLSSSMKKFIHFIKHYNY